jgi:hypothetical protein
MTYNGPPTHASGNRQKESFMAQAAAEFLARL